MKRIAMVLMAALGTCLTGAAAAQAYPTHAVTLIVPSGAGGAADIVARIIAKELENETKQSFVVVNQAGATNTIGVRNLLQAPADGYTTLIAAATSSLATNAVFIRDLPFDTVKDLQPISFVGNADSVLVVSQNLPAKNIAELVALAKSKPGALNYAATSIGSVGHLNMELFKQAAKIDMLPVHYKQTSQVLPDLIAGRVDAWITPIPAVISTISAGKIRALGTSGTARSPHLAGVPTIAETPGLSDFEVLSLYAMFTRTGAPKAVVDRLNALVKKVTLSPTVKSQLEAQGVDPLSSEPEAVRETMIRYIAKWTALVKAANIKVD